MPDLLTPARPGSLVGSRLTGSASRPIDLEFLLYLPAAPPPPEGHPTVLFLHGRGERRTLDEVASFGPPMLARTSRDFAWAVIAPRCPPERGWETWDVIALLDELQARLPLDADRTVITGLSMGGFGTWALLLTHPDRFAAAVPICGGAPAAVTSLIARERLDLIRRVPVRAFHGALDEVVPVTASALVVEELRDLGCADIELTIYPDLGHDSWTRTYADTALWEWLGRRRRSRGAPAAGRPAPGT